MNYDNDEVASRVAALEVTLNQNEAEDTEKESFILGALDFEREVLNGGFSQFLRNSSARYAPIISEALEELGCKEKARVARQAFASAAKWIDASREHLETATSSFDKEYFKLFNDDVENLHLAILEYAENSDLA